MKPLLPFLLLVLLVRLTPASPPGDGEPLSFNRDVRPILSDKCFACHGPDDQHRSADLRLDESDSAYDMAITPGDSAASELVSRILETDPDLQMPPPEAGKEITDSELQTLKRWIDEGARYEAYWAYVIPKRGRAKPAPSPNSVATPNSSPIDALVRRELHRQELPPSSRATRRNQLRRLSLDLTGLPPTYEEVVAFEKDTSPNAYQWQVDRLLATPMFGEQFATYWLDLVRFADTVGYHGDQVHNIAPFRDYVIDAINDSKPLDQFSREQLAGDLLPDPSIEQKIASGYNRLLQTTHEGGLQPKEYLAIYAADRVRNFSSVWMAATVGCAQCHDHKYDPYTARDFYSLAAFFADVDETAHFKNGTNALPTRRDPEIDVNSRTDRDLLQQIEQELDDAESSDDPARADPARTEQLKSLRDSIRSRAQRTMITQSVTPRVTRYLPRGNWMDESGEVLEPAIPAFMGHLEPRPNQADRLTRLDLANWLFDLEDGIGGLTARVFANRLWYLYTGRGVSASLGDFGGQGAPPSNPELLDHLATVLIDSRWDIKATVRAIVTSEAYRQAVANDPNRKTVDPYNDFTSTQSGHRLPAETVRDMTLEIAERLNHQVGGPSARPYQPKGYYRHLNFPRRTYQPDSGSNLWRRSVYTHWQRQFLHPAMKALDAPSREECTALRPRSNTPLEALVLLNDPTHVTAAKSFAARVLRDTSDLVDAETSTHHRIHHAFRIALARDANATELDVLSRLHREELQRFRSDAQATTDFLEPASGDAPIRWPASTTPAQRAAWSGVCRTILNLHETLYRP